MSPNGNNFASYNFIDKFIPSTQDLIRNNLLRYKRNQNKTVMDKPKEKEHIQIEVKIVNHLKPKHRRIVNQSMHIISDNDSQNMRLN